MKNIKVINELVPSGAGSVWKTALYVDGVRIAAGVGKDCHHIRARAAEIMQEPSLTSNACNRLRKAQINGLFKGSTPESLARIILEQEIVTDCNSKASACFDMDDLE